MSVGRVRMAMIEQIRRFPEHLEAVVGHLSVEQLVTPYVPQEWTVAQVVHHIADSHMNSYVRCKLMATEHHPTLKPYDEKKWAELADAKSAELRHTLDLLYALHGRWADFWEALSDTDWDRTGFHPEDGDVSLAYQLELYVNHGLNHLNQIVRILDAAASLHK